MSLEMTIEEVVTELSMTTSCDMNLIVEGDDDWKFFKSCLDGVERVNIVCGWGSDNVCEIIEKASAANSQNSIKPTLGVIDRDYRIPLAKTPSNPNILTTDLRDLECMMIKSRSWANVLRELSNKSKVTALGGEGAALKMVTSAAEVIGAARYYSQAAKINTSFQTLSIDGIICKKTLQIIASNLIAHINARQSDPKNHLPKDLQNKSATLIASAKCAKGKNYFSDPLLLCRGHDVMDVLSIALRSLLSNMSAKDCSRDSIEQRFRLNYVAYFKHSNLAKSIDQWLVTNGLGGTISIV